MSQHQADFQHQADLWVLTLIQGYADIAVLSGNACIPTGTTRTAMVTLFTDEAMTGTTAYQNDEPAVAAAIELFRKVYPCN